jgi:hypothetical protein
MIGYCDACGKHTQTDRAHIRSKGAGGSMNADNIMHFCRIHHIEQHQYGWHKFVGQYPNVLVELHRKGWEFTFMFGIMKLVRKT